MKNNLIKWGVVLFLATAVITILASLVFNRKEEVSISSAESTPAIKVDFDKYGSLLTSEQEIRLQLDLVETTTNKNALNSEIEATIRPSWIRHPSPGETTFIIDAPTLQTSYLISRYVSPEESLDIVNVSCVPDEQKIYPKDYCYEE